MTHLNTHRPVEQSAWNKPAAYVPDPRPDAFEMLRASWSRLRDMPRDVPATLRLLVDDVRQSPQSHALVAILTVVGVALLFVAPIIVMEQF